MQNDQEAAVRPAKKYYVKRTVWMFFPPEHDDDIAPREVTQEEYARLASQQFYAKDAETMERIMESGTARCPLCGTTHMFWTEDQI
jgi:hypothetical protein